MARNTAIISPLKPCLVLVPQLAISMTFLAVSYVPVSLVLVI